KVLNLWCTCNFKKWLLNHAPVGGIAGNASGSRRTRRKEIRMSTNQVQEMRNSQQAEVNAFPMFFAFNKQQFAEGMRKLGLSPSDTRQVCSIFGGEIGRASCRD